MSDLTFVSLDGPTLDNAKAKAVRAHTTKANFRKRRTRLVQEYRDQKTQSNVWSIESRTLSTTKNASAQQTDAYRVFSANDDSKLISYLTNEMAKLYPTTGETDTDRNSTMMHSYWKQLLSDPTMLNVSLYFATHVYAARLRHHAEQFLTDAAKGNALHTLGKRLSATSQDPPDSLIAAILTLTVLDQGLGDIQGWKIHLSGLIQAVTVRRDDSGTPVELSWTCDMISRTIMQGLLLFDRHDSTALSAIESTGVFDTMFSLSGKEAAHRILDIARQLSEIQIHHVRGDLDSPISASSLRLLIESLDAAIDLSRKACAREGYLTAIALSMKIFLQSLAHSTRRTNEIRAAAASQLLDAVQMHEIPCPYSGLVLCSSLSLRFWQSMMGAITAVDVQVRQAFIQRLGPICHALALESWQEASNILHRFFWLPSVFADVGSTTFVEVLRVSPSMEDK